MSLVDEIERLGRDVDNGTITRDAAVQQLLECSDGGLTRASAADLIDNWRTARGRYTSVFDAAREALRKLRGNN
jgi:hypothetical protein